jgi:hypothetical protein
MLTTQTNMSVLHTKYPPLFIDVRHASLWNLLRC